MALDPTDGGLPSGDHGPSSPPSSSSLHSDPTPPTPPMIRQPSPLCNQPKYAIISINNVIPGRWRAYLVFPPLRKISLLESLESPACRLFEEIMLDICKRMALMAPGAHRPAHYCANGPLHMVGRRVTRTVSGRCREAVSASHWRRSGHWTKSGNISGITALPLSSIYARATERKPESRFAGVRGGSELSRRVRTGQRQQLQLQEDAEALPCNSSSLEQSDDVRAQPAGPLAVAATPPPSVLL